MENNSTSGKLMATALAALSLAAAGGALANDAATDKIKSATIKLGTDHDVGAWERTIRQLAESGSADASLMLGIYLCRGRTMCGVAVDMITPIADAGDAAAQYFLGRFLIATKDSRAVDYLTKAASQGYRRAAFHLKSRDSMSATEPVAQAPAVDKSAPAAFDAKPVATAMAGNAFVQNASAKAAPAGMLMQNSPEALKAKGF